MQDKIFELIYNGLFLFIGFNLGRLWIGKKVNKKLADIRKFVDDWQTERKHKFEEINKNLDDIKRGLPKKKE